MLRHFSTSGTRSRAILQPLKVLSNISQQSGCQCCICGLGSQENIKDGYRLRCEVVIERVVCREWMATQQRGKGTRRMGNQTDTRWEVLESQQIDCSPIRGHFFILLEAIKDRGALSSDSTRDTKVKGDRTDMIGVDMPQR